MYVLRPSQFASLTMWKYKELRKLKMLLILLNCIIGLYLSNGSLGFPISGTSYDLGLFNSPS